MNHKILFVDDELNILNSLKREFDNWTYDADFAATPNEALELIKLNNYAVVITDMRMPEMNGVELLEIINIKNPDTIKIVLSGYSDKEMIIDAINHGNIYHYLIKPCDIEDLKLTIIHAAESYSAQYERKMLMEILTQEKNELTSRNSLLNTELLNKAQQIMVQQKELQAAYEKLQKLDKTKSDFMKLVSHELLTPLSILVGYIEIIRSFDKNLNALDTSNIFKIMEESANRLNLIVHEILTAVRLEQPGRLFSMTEDSIIKITETIINNFKYFAEQKSINLILINKIDERKLITIDSAKIRIAIENLLKNAIENTEERGEIQIIVDNYTLEQKDYVLLTVKDNGCGIASDRIDEIWNKFEIAHNIFHHQRGIGLGLTLTKKIIEGHKGKIWVKSELSKGSEFTFILPVVQEVKI